MLCVCFFKIYFKNYEEPVYVIIRLVLREFDTEKTFNDTPLALYKLSVSVVEVVIYNEHELESVKHPVMYGEKV